MSILANSPARQSSVSDFSNLETPSLVLDVGRLELNAAAMHARCRELGVSLRPHLKTSKSVDVAKLATTGGNGPITVSTLKEAEYFARSGYSDILYAVAIAPSKLAHVNRIQRETNARIILVVDTVEAATTLAHNSTSFSAPIHCVIEIDCGEHRSGVKPVAEDILPIAKALKVANVVLDGVMTHAGHSYSSADHDVVMALAETERKSAVDASDILRSAGFPCRIVSVGSTPTVLFAKHLDGITEVRCGIYLFWDLAQLSRSVCKQDDIAVSVLASVIGHNRDALSIVVDAGALALSKDIGANTFLPDAKFGYVCDTSTMARIGNLSVNIVHQEHGTISVPDTTWFNRLPIGSRVRILPNHACLTCAAYDRYEIIKGGVLLGTWSRVNGW